MVNVQWWRCACALYSIAPNTMTKSLTKTPHGQEQCHNGYTLGRLRGQAKWPAGAPIWLPLEFCSFAKRLFYETHINQAIAALRQSIGVLGQFVTVCKSRTRLTHTHTHKHTFHSTCIVSSTKPWSTPSLKQVCSLIQEHFQGLRQQYPDIIQCCYGYIYYTWLYMILVRNAYWV